MSRQRQPKKNGITLHIGTTPHGWRVQNHLTYLQCRDDSLDMKTKAVTAAAWIAFGILAFVLLHVWGTAIFVALLVGNGVRKKLQLHRAQQAFDQAIGRGDIITRWIPSELQEYWEKTAAARSQDFRQVGRFAPSWEYALAENYDVVGVCSPLLEYLKGNYSDTVKHKCREQIWQEMYFLCCRYLDDYRELAAEHEAQRLTDQEANDEGARRYLEDLNGS